MTDMATVLPTIWLATVLRADPAGYDLGFAIPGLMALALVASLLLGVADIRISAYEERAAAKSFGLSCVIGFGLALMCGLLGQGIAPELGVLAALCHFALTIATRFAMAQILMLSYRHGVPRRRVLIYGAGSVGLQALQALKSNPTMVPVGFIDDTPSLRGVMVGGVHVHPPLHLGKLAGRLRAEDVLIARPDLCPADRAALAHRLQASGLQVVTLPAFAQLAGSDGTGPDLAALQHPLPELSRAASLGYQDKVVVVTGAGGSIGSELAHQLLKLRPRRLVLVELSEYALYRVDTVLRPMAEAAGVPLQLVLGSVGDLDLMRRSLQDADVILHAAAYKHVPLVEENPAAALANNALATDGLARLAAEIGVGRFVLVSTDKAVRPAGTMGLSKWIAEQAVRDVARRSPSMDIGIVRFGNVLGSSGSVLPRFQKQVRDGGPVTVTDPRMERYFMSVEQAVHLVLEAGAMEAHGGIFVFDMGRPVRIDDLARRVIRAAGYSVRDAQNPSGDIALRYTGMRPGEKLAEELAFDGDVEGTSHPRIFRVADPILSEFELAQALRDVRRAVAEGRGLTWPAVSSSASAAGASSTG